MLLRPDLQDQLSKTLSYNSDPYAIARQIPFEPPSAHSRQFFNSDFEISSNQSIKPARPMVTPTASFRGAMDWGGNDTGTDHTAQDAQGSAEAQNKQQQGVWMNTSTQTAASERNDGSAIATCNPPRADDYSAFEQDAFAPLSSNQSGARYPINGSADPWAAFRSKGPSPASCQSLQQQDRSQGVDQRASWQQQSHAINPQQRY